MYHTEMELHIDGPGGHAATGRGPDSGAALEALRDFVNTNDLEGGEDELETPEQLHAWLLARELIPRHAEVDADAHRRAIAVREGLRALGRANNGEPIDVDRMDALNQAAAGLPLVVSADPDGWRLTPAATGVDGVLAGLMGTLARSMADGSWSRVKACRRDTCRWLFFDQSRNRSGTWCSMAGCGSRMKARAYRARQREAASA
jgi:predicted RNA-binding Zn ribbon-like protein